jgi:hypothetical protein
MLSHLTQAKTFDEYNFERVEFLCLHCITTTTGMEREQGRKNFNVIKVNKQNAISSTSLKDVLWNKQI